MMGVYSLQQVALYTAVEGTAIWTAHRRNERLTLSPTRDGSNITQSPKTGHSSGGQSSATATHTLKLANGWCLPGAAAAAAAAAGAAVVITPVITPSVAASTAAAVPASAPASVASLGPPLFGVLHEQTKTRVATMY